MHFTVEGMGIDAELRSRLTSAELHSGRNARDSGKSQSRTTRAVKAGRKKVEFLVMTQDEAFAAEWHAAHEGIKHEGLGNGPRLGAASEETHAFVGGLAPREILDDDELMAAWQRGFDEGCQAG